MSIDNEPAKLLLPYLQRADELQKHEPLVAYYCRLYAMERGLKIPQSERTKTTNALLISLMNQLEKDKKTCKLGPDDHLHVEGFALNVFARADKQDRAGRADLNTAKTFYAASIFFEILNQFGEVQPDLEQKQKYAVWKAADIRKAIKEGRKPEAGPPGGEKDLSVPSNGEYDLEPSRSDFPTQPDPSTPHAPDPDSPPQPYDNKVNFQHSTRHAPDPDSPPQPYDNKVNFQHSTNLPSPPSNITPPPPPNIPTHPHYPTDDYPSDNFHHQPPPTNGSDQSIYSQSYHHQPYQPDPQHYPSHDAPPPFSYPNFQSYPSFTESTLPTAPSHYPSYSPNNTTMYPSSTVQHNSSGTNGNVLEASVTKKYEYDSNYQPTPEKIAEAHKAARFAVGALAFDDVSIAVDYLKKSLELLTNPSAGN